MKFSVIIPVFNVEKYLARCLDSVLNQSYSDFEIILVNDGSPDNSQTIIDEYKLNNPDKIKAYKKENGGLSDARNYALQYVTGDYILFLDSDDYIAADLLNELNSVLNKNAVDMLRFSAETVYEDGDTGEIISVPEINVVSGEMALNFLIDNKKYFEPAPFYAYKSDFWNKYGFRYEKGKFHEDFGLTPEIIMRAESFSAIDFIGYFYVQTSSSIMRGTSYEKNVKKSNDILYHSLKHLKNADELIQNENIRDKFCSYIANSVIAQIGHLKGKDKKEYLKTARENNIFNMLLSDNFKRKLKKIIVKLKYGAF